MKAFTASGWLRVVWLLRYVRTLRVKLIVYLLLLSFFIWIRMLGIELGGLRLIWIGVLGVTRLLFKDGI